MNAGNSLFNRDMRQILANVAAFNETGVETLKLINYVEQIKNKTYTGARMP
jgi:hypothetical protein